MEDVLALSENRTRRRNRSSVWTKGRSPCMPRSGPHARRALVRSRSAIASTPLRDGQFHRHRCTKSGSAFHLCHPEPVCGTIRACRAACGDRLHAHAHHSPGDGQSQYPLREVAHRSLRAAPRPAVLAAPHRAFTPKHGSWLNQAEIELSLFSLRVPRSRRISTLAELTRDTRARNASEPRPDVHPVAVYPQRRTHKSRLSITNFLSGQGPRPAISVRVSHRSHYGSRVRTPCTERALPQDGRVRRQAVQQAPSGTAGESTTSVSAAGQTAKGRESTFSLWQARIGVKGHCASAAGPATSSPHCG